MLHQLADPDAVGGSFCGGGSAQAEGEDGSGQDSKNLFHRIFLLKNVVKYQKGSPSIRKNSLVDPHGLQAVQQTEAGQQLRYVKK